MCHRAAIGSWRLLDRHARLERALRQIGQDRVRKAPQHGDPVRLDRRAERAAAVCGAFRLVTIASTPPVPVVFRKSRRSMALSAVLKSVSSLRLSGGGALDQAADKPAVRADLNLDRVAGRHRPRRGVERSVVRIRHGSM